MITFFNRLGTSWVAKIILGTLALSMMAFWGLGGLTNTSSFSNTAVQVGDSKLSTQSLMQAFENARKKLSSRMGGQYVSPSKAFELGLFDEVLNQEVVNLVRFQIAEELGLIASNQAVQKYVEQNPIFHDTLGNFDKNYFYAYLAQSGLSETALAHQLKQELSSKHLFDTVHDLSYSPEKIADVSYKFNHEKRDINLVYLVPSQVQVNQTATEEELNEFYEAYSDDFMKPEYRKIKLVSLTPDSIENLLNITDAEIHEIYLSKKENYISPEQRDLYQIFFKTEEEAVHAHKNLTQENFKDVASSQFGQTDEQTHFGLTTKAQLMEELAEPVFIAQKGAITQPIASKTGWHIFYVKDVVLATQTPESEAKAEIKKGLIAERSYDELTKITRQFEDILGEGKTLSDAAKTLNFTVHEFDAVDITGNSPQQEKIELVNAPLMQEIFTLSKGDTTTLVEHNNGYIVAELVDIDPVGIKPFNDVKAQVQKIWLQEKQKEKFSTVVDELTQQAKKGTPLSQLAKSNHGTFEFVELKGVSRLDENAKIARIKADLFNQSAGVQNIVSNVFDNNAGAVISHVTKITPPDETNKLNLQIIASNEKQLRGDTLNAEIFTNYQNAFDVKVNPKAILQIRSAYQSSEN